MVRSLRAAALLLAVPFLGACSGSRAPQFDLTLAGAQIPVELVESWLRDADRYSFDVGRSEFPTWSQRGFEALAAGECDLACTDRTIEPRELEKFAGARVAGDRVAFYGYALYVHPENRLDSIFTRHMKLVLKKQITDWRQLAGVEIPDFEGPIHVFGPEKSTRAGQILMQQAEIFFAAPSWTALESDAEIINRVADDPLALGFASIGYDEGVRYLGIRTERNGEPAFPSIEEIERNRYGLAKVIYVYYRQPRSPQVEAALDYLFSAAGRRAIEKTDVWPIPRERAETVIRR